MQEKIKKTSAEFSEKSFESSTLKELLDMDSELNQLKYLRTQITTYANFMKDKDRIILLKNLQNKRYLPVNEIIKNTTSNELVINGKILKTLQEKYSKLNIEFYELDSNNKKTNEEGLKWMQLKEEMLMVCSNIDRLLPPTKDELDIILQIKLKEQNLNNLINSKNITLSKKKIQRDNNYDVSEIKDMLGKQIKKMEQKTIAFEQDNKECINKQVEKDWEETSKKLSKIISKAKLETDQTEDDLYGEIDIEYWERQCYFIDSALYSSQEIAIERVTRTFPESISLQNLECAIINKVLELIQKAKKIPKTKEDEAEKSVWISKDPNNSNNVIGWGGKPFDIITVAKVCVLYLGSNWELSYDVDSHQNKKKPCKVVFSNEFGDNSIDPIIYFLRSTKKDLLSLEHKDPIKGEKMKIPHIHLQAKNIGLNIHIPIQFPETPLYILQRLELPLRLYSQFRNSKDMTQNIADINIRFGKFLNYAKTKSVLTGMTNEEIYWIKKITYLLEKFGIDVNNHKKKLSELGISYLVYEQILL